MKAGELRHSVDIVLPIAVSDSSLDSRGQLKGRDTIVAKNVPCSVQGLRGSEFDLARQVMAAATHAVRMRGSSRFTLTTKHKLIFGDRTLNIGYINNVDERDYELRLVCAEEV